MEHITAPLLLLCGPICFEGLIWEAVHSGGTGSKTPAHTTPQGLTERGGAGGDNTASFLFIYLMYVFI